MGYTQVLALGFFSGPTICLVVVRNARLASRTRAGNRSGLCGSSHRRVEREASIESRREDAYKTITSCGRIHSINAKRRDRCFLAIDERFGSSPPMVRKTPVLRATDNDLALGSQPSQPERASASSSLTITMSTREEGRDPTGRPARG